MVVDVQFRRPSCDHPIFWHVWKCFATILVLGLKKLVRTDTISHPQLRIFWDTYIRKHMETYIFQLKWETTSGQVVRQVVRQVHMWKMPGKSPGNGHQSRRDEKNISKWWWFQIFVIFTPYLGKWSNLTNIFEMGWNHQPDKNAGEENPKWFKATSWKPFIQPKFEMDLTNGPQVSC